MVYEHNWDMSIKQRTEMVSAPYKFHMMYETLLLGPVSLVHRLAGHLVEVSRVLEYSVDTMASMQFMDFALADGGL